MSGMTTGEADARIERVRSKCARRRWYGSDMHFKHGGPWSLPGVAGGQDTIYPDDRWITRARQRFLYPPATATDIRLTEDVLRLSLPPLLSRLYTTLGNGGFGPGYGLEGAPGAALLDHDLETRGYYELFCLSSFKRAIPLCNWGCMIGSYLDPDSGRVLRRYLDEEVEAASLADWLDSWCASEDEAVALWEFTPLPLDQGAR